MFNVPIWRRDEAKYCSHACYWEGMKGKAPKYIDNTGKRNSPATEIKKSQRLSPATEFKRKGKNLGYHGLHDWVYRKKGEPLICRFCGTGENLYWANRSYQYKQETTDWMSVCSTCHNAYDRKYGWGLATKKFPEIRRR